MGLRSKVNALKQLNDISIRYTNSDVTSPCTEFFFVNLRGNPNRASYIISPNLISPNERGIVSPRLTILENSHLREKIK